MTRYATLQAAAIALVQGMTRFVGHEDRVTAADDRILDAGIPEAVIFFPGTFEEEEDEQSASRRGYTMRVELFVRIRDHDADTFAAMIDLRDAIIELEELYPHLNLADVEESLIRAEADPEWVFDTVGSGAVFLLQTLRWTAYRRTPLSGGVF